MKAVLLYALSYLLFVHVLRFLDAFQHTYDVFPRDPLRPRPLIAAYPAVRIREYILEPAERALALAESAGSQLPVSQRAP